MSRFFRIILFFTISCVFSQNVVVDNSFGNNGILELPFDRLITNGGGSAKSIILENDQILVLQGGQIDGVTKSYLTKINQNGTIDTTFGTNGFIFFNYYTPYEFSIKIQSDNKIVVFGGHNPVKLYRFLENGQPDLEFGNNGLVLVTNVSNSYAHDTTSFNGERHNLLLLENGKILIHYKFSNLSTSGYKLKCFNSDGSPNTFFGINSELTKNNSSTSDYISEFFFESADNKILGFSSNNTSYIFEKLNLDGSLDLSYGNNGTLSVNLPFSNQYHWNISQDHLNRFFVTYSFFVNNQYIIKYIRINSEGDIDTSFGSNGILENNFGIQNLFLLDHIVYNGKYYSSGSIINNDFELTDSILLRINDNGTLDESYHDIGYFIIPDGGSLIGFQNDDKILLSDQYTINETTRKLFIKRIIDQTLANKDFSFVDVHYQNPISENLKFSSKKNINKILIFNSLGQKVFESKNSTIETSIFPKGIYLANIEFEDNTFTSKKLIKN